MPAFDGFKVGDFVAIGDSRGRIHRPYDNGDLLVEIWNSQGTGWSPTLERKRFNPEDLTPSKPLANTAARQVRLYNKSATEAELVIYSDIGADVFFGGFSANELNDELKKLPSGLKDLSVRINSPGGDVFEGMTIYNRLHQLDARVTVHLDGLAASIASIIAMAGEEVVAYPTTTFMVHKPWTMMAGNADSMRELIERLDAVEDQMIGIYEKKSGLEAATIAGLLRDETYMDGSEAYNYGFVDRVEDMDLKLAASFKRPWLK